MADPTNDPNDPGQQPGNDPGQQNALDGNWYDDFAGDDDGRREQLSQFDSFDAFLEDYNSAKNADWRDAIAGDDESLKTQLTRFAEPKAFGNAYVEAQQKIRSGQYKEALPEDADEETIKNYRKENNIPLEVDEYLKDLPDGLVVGEDDKELMLDFLGTMHELNAPREYAHAVINWYNDFEEKQQDAITELDAEQSREATDQLREAWGGDYRANMNLIKGLLSGYFGEEAADQLSNGRYQDGRGFFNDPNVLKGMAELARKVNDFAPLIEQDPAKLKGLEEEIAELEKYMKEKRSEYNKDEKAQARLRELYDVRLRLENKDAAA